MRDRRSDESTHLRTTRSRAELLQTLRARVASTGLVVAGSALMGLATLGAPATVSGHFRLDGDQTLVPLPVEDNCDHITVPALVTTVSLPNLPDLTTCSSAHTTSHTSESVASSAINTTSESTLSHSGTSGATSRSSATATRPGTSATTSSGESKTAAGVLGADSGTPSTGTDIAFGIGIGLVIAGAGIGTGTTAFRKRRRTIP